jgi:hypothetical protein
MIKGFEVGLFVWCAWSFVLCFALYFEGSIEGEPIIEIYRKWIRYAIDNKDKFSIIGKVVIIPSYTAVVILLATPSLVVGGMGYMGYMVGKVICRFLKVVFLR